jgi:hypothetical protein
MGASFGEHIDLPTEDIDDVQVVNFKPKKKKEKELF